MTGQLQLSSGQINEAGGGGRHHSEILSEIFTVNSDSEETSVRMIEMIKDASEP